MTWMIIGTIASIIILLPQRSRRFLTQFFLFLVTPFRDLASCCGQYMDNLSSNGQKLLKCAGIQSSYFTRAVGSMIVFTITLICLFADLEIIVLSLDAMGLGNGMEGLFTSIGLNPADAMGIALIGASVVWGAVLMDIFKVTKWLPESFIENPLFNKALLYIGIAIISLSLIALVGLASYRYNSLSLSEAELSNLGSNDQGGFELALLSAEKSTLILSIFIIISVSMLMTSIVGFSLLPTVKMVLACVALVIFLIPVVLFFALGKLFESLITLLYNIVLSFFNILIGLSNGVNQQLRKLTRVDDSIDDDEQVAEVGGRSQGNTLAEHVERPNVNSNRTHQQNSPNQESFPVSDENSEVDSQNQGNKIDQESIQPEANSDFDESGFNPLSEEERANV